MEQILGGKTNPRTGAFTLKTTIVDLYTTALYYLNFELLHPAHPTK